LNFKNIFVGNLMAQNIIFSDGEFSDSDTDFSDIDDMPMIGTLNLLEAALCDHKPSFEEFNKISNQDDADNDLLVAAGIFWTKGNSEVAEDHAKSVNFFKKAATRGSPEAKYYLEKFGLYMLKADGSYELVTDDNWIDYWQGVTIPRVSRSVIEAYEEELDLQTRLIKWQIILKNVEKQKTLAQKLASRK
jgi:TPR repeat protein